MMSLQCEIFISHPEFHNLFLEYQSHLSYVFFPTFFIHFINCSYPLDVRNPGREGACVIARTKTHRRPHVTRTRRIYRQICFVALTTERTTHSCRISVIQGYLGESDRPVWRAICDVIGGSRKICCSWLGFPYKHFIRAQLTNYYCYYPLFISMFACLSSSIHIYDCLSIIICLYLCLSIYYLFISMPVYLLLFVYIYACLLSFIYIYACLSIIVYLCLCLSIYHLFISMPIYLLLFIYSEFISMPVYLFLFYSFFIF